MGAGNSLGDGAERPVHLPVPLKPLGQDGDLDHPILISAG